MSRQVVATLLILCGLGVAFLGMVGEYDSVFLADGLKDIARSEPAEALPTRFRKYLDQGKQRRAYAHFIVAAAIVGLALLQFRNNSPR